MNEFLSDKKDSFSLNAQKTKIIQAMHNKIEIHNDSCPILGDCFEAVHSCSLQDYAGLCYYKTLKIKVKMHPCSNWEVCAVPRCYNINHVELCYYGKLATKEPLKIESNKIQKCKR